MISYNQGVFRLTTDNTSYVFQVTKFGNLEHIYYGKKLPVDQEITPFLLKRSATIGCTVAYDESDSRYCLDNMCLEWSGIGRGDYREAAAEIKMPDGSFSNDFIYQEHEVINGSVKMDTLPSAIAAEEDCQTLKVTMSDESNDVKLLLFYSVYAKANVITRRAVLENQNEKPLVIRKLMSMCVDMPDNNFQLTTLDGGWIKEANAHRRKLSYGMHVNSSTTGASSNRHNPAIMLAHNNTGEDSGEVYAFNIVYSGNHYSAVETSNHDIVRVVMGINPYCFEWELKKGEQFETPEAVMTYSLAGFNGMSANMHDFVNEHIVRGQWQDKERPIVLNNWEAHFFKFTRGKLLKLARQGAKAGVEMFVLDDGWFGNRDSDTAGLGDYTVNRRKLPRGLGEFSDKIHGMGMQFGLWFEPEMVNVDSDLYRAHPEYAVTTPGKKASLGRNQLLLDLCNPKVRDYIVENVGKVLDEGNVDYVKWDFNRHHSDAYSPLLKNQGEFFHRYVCGLYEVLERIFASRPHILLESCSSGGNRFDLGMLCYSPQIWTSDNTDPISRLRIQTGLSYFYPLSTMGAHVSEAPHQQTLRDTPMTTRFNVAAFGCLGYELDLQFLSRVQRKEMCEQIEFYKKWRRVFQYGRFYRGEVAKDNKVIWHCVAKDKKVGVTGFFQTLATASEGADVLGFRGLEEGKKYSVKTKPQSIFIKRFGGLVKHILPVSLDPQGFIFSMINKNYAITDCVEEYEGYGEVLEHGIMLNNQFVGSYYNANTRLLGDFGSNLYVVEEVDE